MELGLGIDKKSGFPDSHSIDLILVSCPIYWAIRTSLLPESELMAIPLKYIPIPFSLENYAQLFGLEAGKAAIWIQFKKALFNSLISSGLSTLIVVFISIFSGYAFARLEFKGRNLIFSMVIVTMALVAYAVMIPLYKIIVELGLIDTQTGITLIYTSAFAPLAIWLMRSYFMTIPIELEQAALMDGATKLRAILTILPMALPGLIAVAILTFLNSWSQFVFRLCLRQWKPNH